MAPKKLSDADKQTIIELYRHPDESTSTLASRFGVSSSTISRIVKQGLSTDEYEELVQHKRSGPRSVAQVEVPPPPASTPKPRLKPNRRSQSHTETAAALGDSQVEPSEATINPSADETDDQPDSRLAAVADVDDDVDDAVDFNDNDENLDSDGLDDDLDNDLRDDLEEDDLEEDDLEDDLDDDLRNDLEEDDLEEDDLEDDLDGDLDNLDDDYDDGDDDDDEEDDDDDEEPYAAVPVDEHTPLEILPLGEATLPQTCYLVVDRSANLITRPLKDFADLGRIPKGEVKERTLPIFDNHRVARRFSRQSQRIVKVPDGAVLQKVSPYLTAKGITRLFVEGRVYKL